MSITRKARHGIDRSLTPAPLRQTQAVDEGQQAAEPAGDAEEVDGMISPLQGAE